MTNTQNSKFKLYPHQKKALDKLKSGSILFGDIGSGKTFTSLALYLQDFKHLDLVVITTAKKRDTGDWEREAEVIGVDEIVVDSWNNVAKYIDYTNCFFIFDEQRVVGYGKWGKSFIKIAKKNKWILLSGTPGDIWMDYMTVFIANGFYKNKTDFVDQHVEYNRFTKFPSIKAYHNKGKLIKHRNDILVPMGISRHTIRNKNTVECEYDKDLYLKAEKQKWNVFEDKPIENTSEGLQVIRRIVNQSENRIWYARWIMDVHDKIIVFYNYDYELYILRDICEEIQKPYSEYNGHKHDNIPETDEWIYLVQYTSGSEGWNCIDTNVILFYSMNYSYRQMEQSEGRIDRINTEFKRLDYFYLVSKSSIDISIMRAVNNKRKFNEAAWSKKRWSNE